MIENSTPKTDGFYMPGEFEPHRGCVMIWPERPGSWGRDATCARQAFCQVAEAIAESEEVIMLAGAGQVKNVRALLPEKIQVLEINSDDSWARDVGPTFVVNKKRQVRGVNWRFNAWGGTYDGLYAHWEQDDAVAEEFCRQQGYSCYDAAPFVLEGGSIHSDGEGTLLVTENCLLSPGRNPNLSRQEIENYLKQYLGAEKIIWLPCGIYMDETNEHVDNVCCCVKPGKVLLAWTENTQDPQYLMSEACLKVLQKETDAKGRKLQIVKLKVPKHPVCITGEELKGFVFEDGEDEREEGERLSASYVNFYISNGGVILPQFGDDMDQEAVKVIEECFPDRKVYPVPARAILLGGGNIHCITQQIPEGTNQ